MKIIESVPELVSALKTNKKVILKDDGHEVIPSPDFWMVSPIILIIRSIARKEIYLEE